MNVEPFNATAQRTISRATSIDDLPILSITLEEEDEWILQMLDCERLHAHRVDDLTTVLVDDEGAEAVRLRGQMAKEHDWIMGFIDRDIRVKVEGLTVKITAHNPPVGKHEKPSVAGVATPKRYDQMAYDDLITEAVQRGLDVYNQTEVGNQAISKGRIVQLLREHDRMKNEQARTSPLGESPA